MNVPVFEASNGAWRNLHSNNSLMRICRREAHASLRYAVPHRVCVLSELHGCPKPFEPTGISLTNRILEIEHTSAVLFPGEGNWPRKGELLKLNRTSDGACRRYSVSISYSMSGVAGFTGDFLFSATVAQCPDAASILLLMHLLLLVRDTVLIGTSRTKWGNVTFSQRHMRDALLSGLDRINSSGPAGPVLFAVNHWEALLMKRVLTLSAIHSRAQLHLV